MILKGLGVKDVKVQELFTLDQDSLDILPYASIKVFQREATNISKKTCVRPYLPFSVRTVS